MLALFWKKEKTISNKVNTFLIKEDFLFQF